MNKLARLWLAALAALSISPAWAGSLGETLNTTTSSKTSSTSTTHSCTTIDKGNIDRGYVVNGTGSSYDGSPYLEGWCYFQESTTASFAHLDNTSTALELLTQGPVYTDSGDADIAWNPAWTLDGRPFEVRTYVNGNLVSDVGNAWGNADKISPFPEGMGVPQTITEKLSATVESHDSSDQETRSVSSSAFYVGDFVLGFNTNVNINNNHDDHTECTTYVGTASYDVYTVVQDKYISPIVLDLSGTGTLDASGGKWMPHRGLKGSRLAMFDIRGNGFKMAMEWVGPKAGLLIEPRKDGSVDGTCLFGQADGFLNGYQKLSVRDLNHDGRLSGKELKGLYVWVDHNANAKIDANEMTSLADLKVTEIDLHHRGYRSTFVMNGKPSVMWDWFPTCLDVQKTSHVARR